MADSLGWFPEAIFPFQWSPAHAKELLRYKSIMRKLICDLSSMTKLWTTWDTYSLLLVPIFLLGVCSQGSTCMCIPDNGMRDLPVGTVSPSFTTRVCVLLVTYSSGSQRVWFNFHFHPRPAIKSWVLAKSSGTPLVIPTYAFFHEHH